MMFPGANARIFRNEAGEVLGWDYPSDNPNDDWDEFDQAFEGEQPDDWCPTCRTFVRPDSSDELDHEH